PEGDIKDIDTLLDVPITSPVQGRPIPLRTLVSPPRRTKVPAEITHTSLAPTIDLTMGVYGRDLGHVAGEIYGLVGQFGQARKGENGVWTPYDPSAAEDGNQKLMEGSKIVLTGEYARMQDTFASLGIGLVSASVLIYFLMVALFRSYLTPLVIMSA